MKPGWSLFRRKYLLLLLLLIVILVGVWLYHQKTKPEKPTVSTGPTTQQIASDQSKQAATMLAQKNYDQAAQSYIASATETDLSGQTQQAINMLEDGLAKIPDQYISWSYYDTLAALAKKVNNKSLQIDSVKKALAKAEQPGSGATQDTINIYNTELKQLGAG